MIQDIRRLREIARVMNRYGFANLLRGPRAPRELAEASEPEVSTPADLRNLPTPRRVRLVLAELGTTFIKFGQILSTRRDLLPPEFCDELELLQENVPPFPFSQVRQQFRDAFNKELEEVFQSLDESPLASASIAQVHKGVLKTGETVVLKVQRPGIEQNIQSDMAILKLVAGILQSTIKETDLYDPMGIVEEFQKAVTEELDFRIEADNCRRFAANAKERGFPVVPRIYDDWCARTVIVMEYLEGRRLHEITDPAERKQIVRQILDGAFHQLFHDRFFHGDPHPGNIIVLPGNRVALIDFGLVGKLSQQMHETLLVLVAAVALKDADSAARTLYRMGVPQKRIQISGLRDEIADILHNYSGMSLQQLDPRAVSDRLLRLAIKYGIRLPRDYAILAKSTAAVEGIIREFDPGLDIAAEAMPFARELLENRFDPSRADGDWFKLALRLSTFLQDVPMQVDQVLIDMEAGKTAFTVQGSALDNINHSIRWLGLAAFGGLAACACIIGGFMMLARFDWSWRYWPLVWGGLAFVSAWWLFWFVLVWSYVGQRSWRISLRRWLKPGRRAPAPPREDNPPEG
ncbi:MAG: putative protein kinase UbiB [Myxococcota bacterium]|nr:putative protein kinase UbiB [Myxococcota bacterium]